MTSHEYASDYSYVRVNGYLLSVLIIAEKFIPPLIENVDSGFRSIKIFHHLLFSGLYEALDRFLRI